MTMMTTLYRREFLFTAPLLLAALGSPAATNITLAQQMSDKPQVKRSEVKPLVRQFVEKMSQDAMKYNGVGFTEEQKIKMVNDMLFKMETQGPYEFVDP